jgi:gamma-glutamylcysteine synthetase
MENQEESAVFIDGEEIKESDMTDQQKYFARQVHDLRNKKSRVEFELDQIAASLDVFQKALVRSTKEVADKVLEKDKPLKEK